MSDDAELLRRYAGNRDEDAFAELVHRHLGLVYHAALRQCGGDAHRAEDVAQMVFTDLARKAAKLARRPVLAGWLYTSTRYAAGQAVRTEARRQAREQEVHAMNEIFSQTNANSPAEPAAEWERLRPVIDDALHALGDRDREAVLLRFFEGRGFAEVGAILALSEDAARMRVDRALEKLRASLVRRGITSTTAALGIALANQAAAIAPAGVAATVTGAVLAGATAGNGGLAAVFMSVTTLQFGLAGAIVAVGVAGFMTQAKTGDGLRAEITALREQEQTVARLRDENKALERAATEVETLRMAGAELARLREDVAAARRRPQPAAVVRVEQPLASFPPLAHPGERLGRLHLPDADVETVLKTIEFISGWRLQRPDHLNRSVINLRDVNDVTQAQGVDLMRTALREQAGITLEPGPNGTVVVEQAAGR